MDPRRRLRTTFALFLAFNALVWIHTTYRELASTIVASSSAWRQRQQTTATNSSSSSPLAAITPSVRGLRYHYRTSPTETEAGGGSSLTLLPGDLPGYTGWYRPTSSLAGSFSIERVVERPAETTLLPGSNLTVRVECHHPEGRSGGSLFYARAYGRSILPGLVQDYRNGTYDVDFLFFDAGIYQVEVVLTFSKPPPLRDLPVKDVIAYEGYLLPGFPMEIVVEVPAEDSRTGSSPPPQRVCGMSDLVETSRTSAIERGRWLVTKKTKQLNFTLDWSASHRANPLLDYQSGVSSVGFQADYVPVSCSLIGRREVEDATTLLKILERSNMPLEQTPMIKILFIGDSNMRLQRDHFESHYFGGASLRTELIDTSGGLIPTMPFIRKRLKELQNERAFYFVIFNSGLHDINSLCVLKSANNNHSYINILAPGFSCFEQYGKSMESFVDLVMAFPSELTVFQTTISGWPKWGMFGAAWPPAIGQVLPLSPNAVEHLNDIAWGILERKKVPVMDYYWLSLSRPDNREVTVGNEISRHLVHPGSEVLTVITRKWATMILQRIRDWEDEPAFTDAKKKNYGYLNLKPKLEDVVRR